MALHPGSHPPGAFPTVGAALGGPQQLPFGLASGQRSLKVRDKQGIQGQDPTVAQALGSEADPPPPPTGTGPDIGDVLAGLAAFLRRGPAQAFAPPGASNPNLSAVNIPSAPIRTPTPPGSLDQFGPNLGRVLA